MLLGRMTRHADTTCATGRQQSVRGTLIYSVWRRCFTLCVCAWAYAFLLKTCNLPATASP